MVKFSEPILSFFLTMSDDTGICFTI